MAERYSLRKMANELGFSYETIRKWYLQGMPDDSPEDAQDWIDENVKHKIIGRDDSEESKIFLKARAEREVIRAEQEEITLGLKEGRYYESKYVEPFIFDLYRRTRDAVLALPERLEPIYNPSNPEAYRKAWRKGVDEILGELKDTEKLHRDLEAYIGLQEDATEVT